MASEGPNNAGTGADDAGFGTPVWTDPGNITGASDISSASVVLAAAGNSHYLKATNFGFAIPAGATIDGIVVEWRKSKLLGGTVIDARVRIVKGGAVGSTDKASGDQWLDSLTYASYGSSSDLWGETWTITDINASDFGAVLAANGDTGGGTGYVEHMRITVYYTTPGSPPSPARMTRPPDRPTDPTFIE